jgi:hypothetical protein
MNLPLPKNLKRRGELAELKFATRAAEHGLAVLRPWGDSERFDFVLCARTRLWRTQVKSTANFFRNAWAVVVSAGNPKKRPYRPDEVDLLACYIFPEDLWYLIPVGPATQHCILRLCPHLGSNDPYRAFRDAWHLLR